MDDGVLAELAVLVGANISGLQAGLNQADRDVQGFAGRFVSMLNGLSSTLTRVGGQVAMLTLPLAVALTGAVSAGLEFDKTMTNVAAVVGQTREEMAGVADEVLALGADALAGPQAAAAAYYDIVGGVTDATSRMAVFETAIATAEAGSADLGATTSALISVMNGYKFGAEDAAFASDVMTRAVGVGVGTMEELAGALPDVAGLAANVGISFDDLAASLAFVTTKGFSFSEASTQVSAMITAMIKPNEMMKDGLAELGFASGEAAIQQLGLVGAYQALSGTQSAATNGVAALTGSVEALNGVISLTDEAAAGFLADFSIGLDGLTDAAREIQRSSPAAEMELARARAEALGIAFSRLLLPSIGGVAAVFNDFALKLFDFINRNPELTRAIAEVAVLMVAAGPVISGVGIALGLLLNPVALAVGGLAALAIVVRTNQAAIHDWLLGLEIANRVAGLEGVARYINASLAGIRIGDTTVGEIVEDLRTKFESALNNLRLQVGGFVSGVGTAIEDGIAALNLDLTGIRTTIETGVQDSIAGLSAIDTSGVQAWANENFDRISGIVISVAGIVLGGPFGLAIGAARLVSEAIENDFLGIRTFLEESGIVTAVEDGLNTLKSLIEGVIDRVFGGGGEASDSGGGAAAGGGNTMLARIGADLEKGLQFIQDIFTRIGPGIQEGLDNFFGGVEGFFEALADTNTDGLYEVVRVVGAVLGGIVTVVTTAAGQGIETILTALGNVLPIFGQALSSIIEAVAAVGRGDVGGALRGITDAIGGLASIMPTISLTILDGLIGFFEKLTGLDLPNVQEILDGMGLGFSMFFDNLRRGVDLLVADLQIFTINAKVALDALTGGHNQDALVQEMVAVVRPARNMRVSDSFTEMLQTQISTGQPIDLSVPLGQVDFGGGYNRVYGAMAEMLDPQSPEFQMLVAGMGVTGKVVVEDALREAFTIGDQHTITLLQPLAVALGVDVAQVEADAGAQIATANPIVGIQAALQVSPFISFVTNVVTAIQNAIGALNIPLDVIFSLFGYGSTGGGDDNAEVEPPGVAVGTPYVRREGLARLHEGEAVLTASENAAFRALRMRAPVVAADGGGGRSIVINLTNYANSPDELVDMLERAIRRKDL
ncbi:MAG: phage tail tape measure protein [Anaerolineae bacterium]|nr:phage tail tape measure protein [Anaerolineae bacterium]